MLHYLQQIFEVKELGSAQAGVQIWDFLSEHARRKFNLSVDREVLTKVHLNGLLKNILDKLNIRLSVQIDQIDFSRRDGKFFTAD